ncbi:MAG: class II glutamine amidotransferase [Alphaproteobacteria bacterium]|nr:class II glutamine amidotransferase [Alphaproteobacteria bacterium]
MCRWIAYRGSPVLMESLVAAPERSLISQSINAAEGKTPINGDGFGLGWYGEKAEPGLYREVRPAWSDENLRSICAQVRSRLFFAHVRASTGSESSRANCHPFAHDRYLFMHNGAIDNYDSIRRRIDTLIPDEFYHARRGTTDSEAIFLAALGFDLAASPASAMARTLKRIAGMLERANSAAHVHFTSALSDGENLWAFRWASDGRAPSLYWRRTDDALVIVSEPLDNARESWQEVPQGCMLIANGERTLTQCMNAEIRRAA